VALVRVRALRLREKLAKRLGLLPVTKLVLKEPLVLKLELLAKKRPQPEVQLQLLVAKLERLQRFEWIFNFHSKN
jgi:hypothetical protein